ncbi:MAG: hypothetical protein GXP55_08995, partial [Deltaproteobacteria bacterium]|nr:hypothetical protein [Deltaproteobacteria bacterium]
TDVTTTGNDPSPQVVAMVGVGPHSSDPATDTTWVWNAATPNTGYTGAEPNNDEYMGDVTVLPAVGGATSYDYAYRFSADRGVTWTYCDTTDVGSPDGYIIADAGQMTSRPAAPVVATLIFSEYVEGSSSNKALEITNIGTTPADLSTCSVQLYRNGSSSVSTTIALSGILTTDILTAGSSLVLCNTRISDATNCDSLTGSISHNGDDAYDLVCGTTVKDTFGQIGTDPGVEWAGGGISTQNQTLRRKCSVTTGDTNGADAFDPSVEWDGFPIDTLGDLGSYTCP